MCGEYWFYPDELFLVLRASFRREFDCESRFRIGNTTLNYVVLCVDLEGKVTFLWHRTEFVVKIVGFYVIRFDCLFTVLCRLSPPAVSACHFGMFGFGVNGHDGRYSRQEVHAVIVTWNETQRFQTIYDLLSWRHYLVDIRAEVSVLSARRNNRLILYTLKLQQRTPCRPAMMAGRLSSRTISAPTSYSQASCATYSSSVP